MVEQRSLPHTLTFTSAVRKATASFPASSRALPGALGPELPSVQAVPCPWAGQRGQEEEEPAPHLVQAGKQGSEGC